MIELGIPIHVWHDSGVEDRFVEEGIKGLEEVLRREIDVTSYVPIKYYGAFEVSDGEFGGADWYFAQSYVRRLVLKPTPRIVEQINGSKLFELCSVEPYQRNPHYEFIITRYDLWSGDEDNNFVFGLSTIGELGIILSYCRMKGYGREALNAFKIMSIHEWGHRFGLPVRNYNVEYRLGKHCVRRDCAMGQVNIPGRPTLLEATIMIEAAGRPFCPDCQEDLRRSKERLLDYSERKVIVRS